jgi:hypothetical protein
MSFAKEKRAASRAELRLSYFKPGDDLSRYIESTGNISEALAVYAQMLDEDAAYLRELRDAIVGEDVFIEGGNDWAFIHGASKLINRLINEGLAVPDRFEDDEEEHWADVDRRLASPPEPLRPGRRAPDASKWG